MKTYESILNVYRELFGNQIKNLCGACLSRADLSGADLHGAIGGPK